MAQTRVGILKEAKIDKENEGNLQAVRGEASIPFLSDINHLIGIALKED